MNDDDIYETYADDGDYDTYVSMDGLLEDLMSRELSDDEREFVHQISDQEQFTVKQIKQLTAICLRVMFGSATTKLKIGL